MKKAFLIILVLPQLCLAQGDGGTNVGGVHFIENRGWEQIKEIAKKEHKYIFVDCFATWCGPCKAMDKKIYPNDSVGNIINQDFLSVKMQCDTSKNDGDNVKARYTDAHNIVAD